MTRLRHSYPGFLRGLQIGSPSIFLITEGRIDRPFFSSLVSHLLVGDRAHVVLSIRSARELPKRSGGKTAVLAYYDFLRKRKQLISTLAGKKTVILFCLDKDLDDMTRKKRRSPHVIYTEYFDVESYLFKFGDLQAAASAATTIDRATFAQQFPTAAHWTAGVANAWKDWVSMCVLEVIKGFPSTGNYGVCPSPVNDPAGPVNGALLNARLTLIQQNSGLNDAEFKRQVAVVARKVEALFKNGDADKIFKGKWYVWLFARDTRAACTGRDAELGNLEQRLPLHLLQTLDFSLEWAASLRAQISAAIDTAVS
jgi:hypothetical protein